MDELQVLQNYGLEVKEAKTYLALLKLGEATATQLAEETTIDRSLMYQLTNKLIEKGLCSYIIKNKIRYFLATDPKTLTTSLEQKKTQIREIMPKLKEIQNWQKQDTKVELYYGRKGVTSILMQPIKEKEAYYFFGGATEACKIFRLEAEIFVKNAERLNLKGKILAKENDAFFIGKNEDYRLIPNDLILSTTLFLFGGKTAIMVWNKPYYAILIENEEIFNNNISTFNYLWKAGKKPAKTDVDNRLLK